MKKDNKLLKNILETQIEEIRKQNKGKKKEKNKDRGSYINQIIMIMLGLSVIVGLIYSFVKLF
ncbi:hypothetical protein [uncultured Gemella sp.]|uniref:hypothetical protein n=1 Tax=uncultured Gemella sp. TaxID=254352 RepID=UPI0028D7F780|nr:hypothetical protein [uncultured Gemella sp.]